MAKYRFEGQAGWVYGLVVGLALILAAWGWDAWQLKAANLQLFWIKLVPALVTVIPLSMLAGWLAAQARRFGLLKLVIWIIWGAAVGVLAIHFPFDWANTIAGWIDPATRGLVLYPLSDLAEFRAGMMVFFGIAAALVITLLQILATEWAWDRSTVEGALTPLAVAMLLVVVPIAWVLGALDDSMANADLRAPILLTAQMVDTALQAPPDLNTADMPSEEMILYMAAMRWRRKVSGQFIQYLAGYDAESYSSATADMQFDNGLILRCQVTQYGKYIGACFDLKADYNSFMREFVQKGTATCADCTVRIEPAAKSAVAAARGDFGEPTAVSVSHHLGGVVLVDVTGRNGHRIECRLTGAQPIVIHDCTAR